MGKSFEDLPNGDIKFNGVIYPRMEVKFSDIKFNFDKWLKHWEKIIKEIKEMKLNYEQIIIIQNDFTHDMLMYMRDDNFKKRLQEFGQLSTELKIAYQKSYSNYRDSKNGFWAFISGLFVNKLIERIEIPEFPLNLKGVK